MNIDELNAELVRRSALVVHCSRPGRGGETIGEPKPLYPADLKATMVDLVRGGVREVSCSLLWPDHQKAFGSVGIILKPRRLEEIVRICTEDAGNISGIGGFGEPYSAAAVEKTFRESVGHNEWVLTGAEVRGVFVDLTGDLLVARSYEPPEGIDTAVVGLFGSSYVAPAPITADQVASDFPDLPLYGFSGGRLRQLNPKHPYE